MGVTERKNTLVTRTFKYLNQDTITALQSFQIERSIVKSLIFRYKQEMNTVLNVDVIILVWLRVILLTFVNVCFVVKNAGTFCCRPWSAYFIFSLRSIQMK